MLTSSKLSHKFKPISKHQMELNLKKNYQIQSFYQPKIPQLVTNFRFNRMKKQQKSTKYNLNISGLNKQNVSYQQNNISSKQNTQRNQNISLTEFSYQKSNHNTSRSKRKKTQRSLFINVCSSRINYQNRNIRDKYIQNFISNNQSNFSDNTKQSFNHSDNVKQNDIRYSHKCKFEQVDRQMRYSHRSRFEQIDTNKIKVDKYECIRNTMKKLKNLSQIKYVKKRTQYRVQTTQQQWNQIQKIVQLTCRQHENKQISVKQILTIQNNKQIQNYFNNKEEINIRINKDQQYKVSQFQISQKYVNQQYITPVKTNLRDQHIIKQQIKQKIISSKPKIKSLKQIFDNSNNEKEFQTKHIRLGQINQQIQINKRQQIQTKIQQQYNCSEIKQVNSKIKEVNKEIKQVNRQKQQIINNKQLQQSKINNNNKVEQLSQDNQKKNSNLSYNQFYSLILIFEHILYLVPTVIDKGIQLCRQYEIDPKSSIFLFFNYLYLNKKLIQIKINQLNSNFYNQHNHIDYSQVIKQIKKDNTKNFNYLIKLKQDLSNKNNIHLPKQIINLQLEHSSIQSLRCTIQKLQKQFISSNSKIMKKMLKKISSSPKTNIKQFHTFLNYSCSFINLYKVHSIINKVINNQLYIKQQYQIYQNTNNNQFSNIQNHKQNIQLQQSSQITYNNQQQINQNQVNIFLYQQCQFIQNKYLLIKQKLFQIYFEIHQQHHKIQIYYHTIIKQFKYIETIYKINKSSS